MIIGITGGTGAGKTTALKVLEKLGFTVIDCDALYHERLENDPALADRIMRAFPESSVNGRFDRKALGHSVFSDRSRLEKLNALTNDYMFAAVRDILASKGKAGRFAIDAIGLFESGLGALCDAAVAVTAPADVRAARIVAREGISLEYARMRIAAQKPDSYFTARCGYELVNDCRSSEEFALRAERLFLRILGGRSMKREELFYEPKNAGLRIDEKENALSEDYCGKYKAFLDTARTEREAVREGVRLAEQAGFVGYKPGMELKAGDKIYYVNRAKSLMLAVMGKKDLSHGANIAAAHIDSPRLDLKQMPLYEDSEIAYFKTHYYGGIRKYHWVTVPLELRGVIVKADGSVVDVSVGAGKDDPVFVITDLLPHLAADQNKKTLTEAIVAENLNLIVGSLPDKADDGADRVKLAVLRLLFEKYGIREEDFLSAELEAVPALPVRDVGLDRSLIGAYGHDDRVCGYAALQAILETDEPEKTAICVLADKEEIGSEGVSGMQSHAFECFVEDLCAAQGVEPRRAYEKSFCISADVTAAFDPVYPEVSEKRNNARLNYGVGVCKFTGARGKSGSSDASAEVVARTRRLFDSNGVIWQMGELGKVDQGGGGTVAMYMANRNIDTIDAGVPVLAMHAPYEIVAKLDCYMMYKSMKALYDSAE